MTRILIVDDEPDITLSFKMILEGNGFKVDTYNDPVIAKGNFKPDAYDLVILDIRMPKVDGFEVLKWLQSNRTFRPAHVVVFSSSCDPRDIEQAMALGADDYKMKPLEISAYLELVREFEMRAF